MKIPTLAAALAVLHTVVGHTAFTTLFVDDANQGDGVCVRMGMNPSTATNPLTDLTSTDLACGFGGTTGVARVCPVPQSAKLSFLFRTWPDNTQPGSIDSSHKGPCAIYMKAVDSATKDPGAGDGWFKIWDEGYDAKSSQWCTEKLIKNNGFLSVRIPSDLAGGYYLIRPELLSLHESDKGQGMGQFYTGCAQIFLKSKETAVPRDTVSIPGHINIQDPSVNFNVWTPRFPYKLAGPPRYTSSSPSTTGKALESQTEGLLPNNAILTNANWAGIEVPSYSSESSCWTSTQNCWDQCSKCFSSAPPTGSKNCKIWEAKCTRMGDSCSNANPRGPLEAEKNLNPPLPVYNGIPPAPNDGSAAGGPTTGQVNDNVIEPVIPIQQTKATPIQDGKIIPNPPQATNPISDSGLKISNDARCGDVVKQTCTGSAFGSCCSTHGWCGSTDEYCGKDRCQAGFGSCGNGKRGLNRFEREGYF